jgi:hypothetical protein
MNKTYLIEYHVSTKSGKLLKSKKPARINNAMSKLHAQIKLEISLKNRVADFKELIVDSCIEDYDGSNFIDFFNDMIKGTPFD